MQKVPTMTTGTLSHPVLATTPKGASDRKPSTTHRIAGFLCGALVFALCLGLDAPGGMSREAWCVASVGVLMATWWVLEAIPIAATALAPLVLFPLLGVMPMNKAAAPYANPLIFLFLGGFVIALAMERWNLHRRLALQIIRVVGLQPAALVGGFMVATAFLSMWVSNTATATMMLPIGLSVIKLFDTRDGERMPDNFSIALLLSIAYGANIGGIATLIGTPPNALLAGFMNETYGVEVGFGQWMLIGMPLSLTLLVICWLILTRIVFPLGGDHIHGAETLLEGEIAKLGPMSRGEKLVGLVFLTTALLWVFRPLIDHWTPGINVTDPGIAVIAAISVFAIPVRPRERVFLLDWSATQKLPWGVLLLFGGGLSLGAAFSTTGLSGWVAAHVGGPVGGSPWVIVAATAAVVMLVSHFTSNTATIATFLPLIGALAMSLGQNPLMLAVPAVLAASCAFMLPVATPPNAIVFAEGILTVPQMVRAGALINVVALSLILAFAYTVVMWTFGIELGVLPEWAV